MQVAVGPVTYVEDIRGMGLQVSKLETADSSKQGKESYSIKSWLTAASAKTNNQNRCSSHEKGADAGISETASLLLWR
ncbi:hypothetical protein CQW23_20555 [Capsicum baccatum]|uniref:Uncharacterized protein n=1 Tax=Capsicum baccatum TaxID=33114 RepID=A0A2G2W8Z1_CAPBA|nr:hypothetical protein CQW23_20555 [Capsicum baccatum]